MPKIFNLWLTTEFHGNYRSYLQVHSISFTFIYYFDLIKLFLLYKKAIKRCRNKRKMIHD